jgi:hypothetical protein
MLDDFTALLDRIVAPSVGRPVHDVVYWSYPEHISDQTVADGVGFIIGEVELVLASQRHLFLSWAEREGDFSLALDSVPLYQTHTLSRFAALHAPEWCSFQGRPILSAELLGSDGVPHVLVLTFENGGVMIADGYEDEIGDGDHVIIRKLPEVELLRFPDVLWRA